jgi:PadR family transcriptional regulator, regulatory protein PadR
MESVSKEMVGATATKFILAILNTKDSYGYEIVQRVHELSNGRINWNVASIYPVLKKLENSGCIKSYWRMEESERPRKYYNLLEPGKDELQKGKDEWELANDLFKKL